MNTSNTSTLLCILFISSSSVICGMEKKLAPTSSVNNLTRHASTSLERDGRVLVSPNHLEFKSDTDSLGSYAAPAWGCEGLLPCIYACINQCSSKKNIESNDRYQRQDN